MALDSDTFPTTGLTGHALELLADVDHAGTTTLGDLAEPAVLLPGDSLAPDVDEVFRKNDGIGCVVLDLTAGPVLVERGWFEAALTGRLGYGRLLHARRPVADMVTGTTIVLDHDCPVVTAASEVIGARPSTTSSGWIVVRGADGHLGVTHATSVFECLARHYAYQSLHDTLTGLPNRAYLAEHIRRTANTGRYPVVFYVDLDRFKEINDQYGHAAGDQVLRQFAERLRATARADDVVVRLAGDEFALVVGGPLTVGESTALAERLLREASTPFTVVVPHGDGAPSTHPVSISASVGVAHADRLHPSVPISLVVLLKQADRAMYRAKEHGRARAALFEHGMATDRQGSAEIRARREMERRLRRAIDDAALTVHYQPVVHLGTGRAVGVEALARWDDDQLGPVPPGEFIPLAEATGLILDLGHLVLRQACLEAARWAPVHGTDLTVHVNVSAVELTEPEFLDHVLAALDSSGLAAGRLCLEVTETAAISDLDAACTRLEELRRHGVRVALDDFGTGHSSLTMLRRLPLTDVKVDRSFVTGVATDPQDAALVRMVIDVAHSLGLRVCAEGIEDAEQAARLVAMGCDTAQGWHFGRPLPAGPDLRRAVEQEHRPGQAAAPAPPYRASETPT